MWLILESTWPLSGSSTFDEENTMKLYGLYELAYMQACRVATALRNYYLAEQYAKATLGCYTNPVHQCFARQRLGGLSAMRERMGGKDGEWNLPNPRSPKRSLKLKLTIYVYGTISKLTYSVYSRVGLALPSRHVFFSHTSGCWKIHSESARRVPAWHENFINR